MNKYFEALDKFNYENIKNKKSQNNDQIALNLTWKPNKELSSEYEGKATYELSSLKRPKLTPLDLDI